MTTTVKELIGYLQDFDPNMEVLVQDGGDSMYLPLQQVECYPTAPGKSVFHSVPGYRRSRSKKAVDRLLIS